MASALSQLSTFNSSARFRDLVDTPSIDAGDLIDSPAFSPQYEEPVEIFTHAVFNINWLAEKGEVFEERQMYAPCRQNHSLHIGVCHSFQILRK